MLANDESAPRRSSASSSRRRPTSATLLDENRHLVVALRDALLEREELVGDEILDVLQQAEAELEPATTPSRKCA